MASPFTVTRPAGRASFQSVIRSWDESPQDAFSVGLGGQSTLYGIWRPKWAPNENDFDVEIVSFGWADKNSTGHPNPATRTRLSAAQAEGTKALTIALFQDVEARRQIIPFSGKGGRFLGGIGFREDWILLKD
jgi:hypothetical protein